MLIIEKNTRIPKVQEYRKWLIDTHFYTETNSGMAINGIRREPNLVVELIEQAIENVIQKYPRYSEVKPVRVAHLNNEYQKLLNERKQAEQELLAKNYTHICVYCGFSEQKDNFFVIHEGICMRLFKTFNYIVKNDQDVIEINKVVKHIQQMKKVDVTSEDGQETGKVDKKGNAIYTIDGKEVVFIDYYNSQVKELYERLK